MQRRGRLPAALVALGVLLFACVAEAQRVALVRPSDNDAVLLEVFNRLSAELRLQDFEVAILDTGVEARTEDALADVARRTSSVAAVRFFRRGESTAVDVWLGTRAGGTVHVHTIEPPGGIDAPNVLAIRTVDLLRTTLREFGGERLRPVVAPPETRPPPAPRREPEQPPNWTIRAEGIILWNRPTLGLAFGAALGLTRRVADHVEIGLVAAGPVIVGRNWATPEGEASVRHEFGWAELRLSGWRAGPFVVGTSGGAGVFRTEAAGIKPRELSTPAQVWSFAGTVGGHVELPLGGNAAIGATLRAIGLTPRPSVGIGRTEAVVLFPLLGVSAGLLVGF
ncbi:MAG TPA: hypothetical protein VK550_15770 [Polyangiaceae bacterium]|jgi:hypothetical protein|nr:hypothetical protein [Polyangiaceae bacterium]